MPPVISTMVEAAPEEFRQAVALSCLAPLGVVGCQLEAVYLDGNAHTPLFQTAISAPQASGKSWLINIADRLMKPVTEMDDAQLAMLKDYCDQVAELRAMHPRISMMQIEGFLGPRPKPIVRDLGAKVSTTAMMELMDNAQGLAIVLRSDEADSLVKSWLSRNTDVSDMLRIGWDGGWYKQNMASVSKTYSGKVRLRMATMLAGTPDAFCRLFPNVQNGAVSRQLIVGLDDMFGCHMPTWRKLTEAEEAEVDSGLARLNAVSVMQNDDGVEVQPRYEMDLSYVNKSLAEWCAEQTALAKSHNSHTRWVFHKRCAVMGFRAAILAHFLWGESADEAVRGKVCDFALWVADMALLGLMKRYELPEDVAKHFFAKKPYDALSDTFTIGDLAEQLQTYGLMSQPYDVICKWKRGNRVRFSGKTVATSRGMKRVYEKIKPEVSVMEE